MSENIFELDKTFSTTRRVVKNNQDNGVKKSLFISKQSDRSGEGGLRTRGYYKRSESGKPLISVITVVYNGKEHIERAVRSVLKQTYDNVEYIIIDGGSTDGTLDIIKRYEDAVDYWISEPDEGVYDAMNKGVKILQGDYILFLGCDDHLFDVFHEIVDSLHKRTVSYYGDVLLSKNKKIYDGRFYPLKLFKKNIPHQAIFYSKHVFGNYKYNCKYITLADYALNLKIFSNKKYGLKYIPKTIAYYNNESGLSSTLIDPAFSLDRPELIYRYYPIFYYLIHISLRFISKIKKIRS